MQLEYYNLSWPEIICWKKYLLEWYSGLLVLKRIDLNTDAIYDLNIQIMEFTAQSSILTVESLKIVAELVEVLIAEIAATGLE